MNFEQFVQFIQKNSFVATCSVAFIIFLLTQWLTKRRLAIKAFGYAIPVNTVLVSKGMAAKDRVKILFDDRQVEGVRLVEVELKNTGSKEIVPSDFHKPLMIVFPDESEILEASIVSKFPDGFDPQIEHEKTSITFKPTLMNSEDSVVIKALVTGSKTTTRVEGRIAGVKNLTNITAQQNTRDTRILTAILLLFIGGAITWFGVSTFNYSTGATQRSYNRDMAEWRATVGNIQTTYAEKISHASLPYEKERLSNDEMAEIAKHPVPDAPSNPWKILAAIGICSLWVYIDIMLDNIKEEKTKARRIDK